MIQVARLFLLSLVFLSACSDGGTQKNRSRFLPSSMGGFDQLMVVVDQNAMKTGLKDTLKRYFGASYEVLYRYEPKMDVSFIGVGSFKNFITRSRNIMFLGTVNGTDATSRYMKEMFSGRQEETPNGVPSERVEFRKNVWARNQLVGFALATDREALERMVADKCDAWIAKFMDSDLPEYRQFTYMSGVNESLKKQLKEYYHVEIDIPLDFKLAKNEDGFIWLRRDDPEMMYHVMIDIQDLGDSKKPFRNKGLLKRNKLGVAHISSDMPGSYMSTDSTLGFIQEYHVVNGNPRYENRGLWRMENDFMGGPFLNYYIHDTKNNQIVFIEGFVYGPSEDKKPAMRQMETILSTFKVI